MTRYTHRPLDPVVQPFDRLVDPVDRLVERLVCGGSVVDERAPTARLHLFGHDHDHGEGEPGDENDILAAYRRQAEELHERIVHEHGVFTVEFLGSTGSGKTSLLEHLLDRAPADETIGVIVGDVAGDDDAARLREHGVQVANVNTGKECHLDPSLVESALEEFDLTALDTLYLENVGNMVCPADFPLGAQARILVVSTTEGDDVVRKHPLLFQACDATVVNKVDIADAVDADVAQMRADVGRVGGEEMPVFETSVKTGAGLDDLVAFVEGVRTAGREHGHGTTDRDHRDAAADGDEERTPTARANGTGDGTDPEDDHVHAHPHDDVDAHSHAHEHAHRHDHDHEHVDESGEAVVHSHDHEHVHSHDHSHDHGHGHEHEDEHDHRHTHAHDHDHDDDPEHEPGPSGVPRHDHDHDDDPEAAGRPGADDE